MSPAPHPPLARPPPHTPPRVISSVPHPQGAPNPAARPCPPTQWGSQCLCMPPATMQCQPRPFLRLPAHPFSPWLSETAHRWPLLSMASGHSLSDTQGPTPRGHSSLYPTDCHPLPLPGTLAIGRSCPKCHPNPSRPLSSSRLSASLRPTLHLSVAPGSRLWIVTFLRARTVLYPSLDSQHLQPFTLATGYRHPPGIPAERGAGLEGSADRQLNQETHRPD